MTACLRDIFFVLRPGLSQFPHLAQEKTSILKTRRSSPAQLSLGAPLSMLDCNANPGIFYPPGQFGSADFILSLQPDGHRAFLAHILDCALRAARPRT
jgi:hypothetical protein